MNSGSPAVCRCQPSDGPFRCARVTAMTVRARYLVAAECFAALIDRVPSDVWDAPALGAWTVRDLVGHTAVGALSQVLTVLDRHAEAESIPSPEGYYAVAKSIDPSVYQAVVTASTERARSDGEALGDQPTHLVRAWLNQVNTKLERVDEDTIVEVHELVGGMRVGAWLPTRTFELAVHSIDVAAATGVPADLPTVVVADAAALAARIAVATGDGSLVLRALTGRGGLPNGFSVV